MNNKYFELVRHPLRIRTLRVAGASLVTPRMRRIELTGDELSGFVSLAPEDHVRVFFCQPGETTPALPSIGALGVPLPSFGGQAPVGRDYTPRSFDTQGLRLYIDFFLHGTGVASRWAAGACPGDLLGVGGPRGSYVVRVQFPWILLVGDETALPEFARRLEETGEATQKFAVIIVEDEHEEQPLVADRATQVVWVHRAAAPGGVLAAVFAALTHFELPVSPGRVGHTWLAGEALETRAIKQHLVNERSFPADLVHASGHWKRGVVNHDHHEAIEV